MSSDAPAPAPLEVPLADWLHNLWQGEPDGPISLLIRTPDGPRTAWATTIDQVRAIARTHVDAGDIWIGPSPRVEQLGTKRGGIDQCTTLSALWVDIDIAGPGHAATGLPTTLSAALDLLALMPLRPSCLVHTGGGLQAWWWLAEPTDHQAAVDLLTGWGGTWATLAERAGVAIDNVFNLDRVLRLPNTLNHKLDEPRPVRIIGWAPERRYGLDDIAQHLLDPPTPPPALAIVERVPYIGPRRPGDHFNATVTPQHILQRAGWTFARRDRTGDEHWARPGKDPRAGTSATIYAVDGHTTIWSDAPTLPAGVQTRRPYDPFGLHVALNHHGDHAAAARELAALGYGERTVPDVEILAWAAHQPPPTTSSTTPPVVEPALDLHLPAVLWDSRPWLTHLHQAARARLVAPDAVLAALLCRIAAATPHIVDIPAIIGTPVGLTLLTALVGPPAAGKSAAAGVAAELLPVDTNKVRDRIPIGSGEGFTEILYGMRPDPDNPRQKIRTQTHNAAIFHIDEGQVLADLGNRSGSTLLPTLRTAFTHGTLGNANATLERRRLLAGHQYVYGVSMGIQPSLAGPILADHAAGTPQRFLWLSATDPGIGDHDLEWPGPLDWTPPTHHQLEDHETASRGGFRRSQLHYHPAIVDQVRTQRIAAIRGDSPGDAHGTLLRLKIAAVLALGDHTMDVDQEHWALAGIICDTSTAVRSSVEHTLTVERRGTERAADERRARTELHVEGAKEQRRLDATARTTSRAVHRCTEHTDDGCPRRCLRYALSARDKRELAFDDIVDTAIAKGWITPDGDRFRPGESRPA